MQRTIFIVFIIVLFASQSFSSQTPQKPVQPQLQSKMDIAFCLDTTGSMSGLIEGAKEKIWSIVNAVSTAKQRPVLRIAMIGYRDNGDAYVTRVHDFTSDLETMYMQLRAFRAEGGGDEPEHVNRALFEAVNKLQWSKDPAALKILYLVGDAPPHMDYQDGYDYRKISSNAAGKGIIVNTIQCGQGPSTRMIWQEIARLAEGKYAAIDQSGGMIAVASPYDEELARLGSELNKTYVAYGSSGVMRKSEQVTNDADAKGRGTPVAAERAAAKSNFLYRNDSWDLVDATNSKTVSLKDLKPEDLPAELKGKSESEQKAYLQKQSDDRLRIQNKIQELSQKRDAYVSKESKSKNGFDAQVLQTLKDQAKTKGITFEK